MDVCVNPACGAVHSQDDYRFADVPARVKSFPGDRLPSSVDPPAIYGMIQFEGGGRMMADFTDCEQDDLEVGLPARMAFRKHAVDRERGFTGYFWKAVPLADEARRGGAGGSKGPADRVVKEIEEIGGEAIASYASVTAAEGGEEIVRAALEKWGQVDILINNAGILRDKTF